MSDIVERLRSLRHTHVPQLSDEAAAEIERLRQVVEQKSITDSERESVEWCIFQQATPQGKAVALRRLLDRLG